MLIFNNVLKFNASLYVIQTFLNTGHFVPTWKYYVTVDINFVHCCMILKLRRPIEIYVVIYIIGLSIRNYLQWSIAKDSDIVWLF